jgi:signal transduction histidine kinase
VVVFRDITKERAIDKTKSEFVSLASHQLRTPLSAINWYAEMLIAGDAGELNEEQKSYVDEIYRGNQRMVELVNALLNVSRLELGTFAIEPRPTNVIEVADTVLNELQPDIERKMIHINRVYDENIGIINLDPELIRIIIQNLLSNAVKYTPEEGKVSIKIEKIGKDVLIQVSDTGMGIPKKQQENIFSKLFRADNARESDSEGTGLGLYIVKSILESAGGAISFESVENTGASFSVTIPASGWQQKTGSKSLK